MVILIIALEIMNMFHMFWFTMSEAKLWAVLAVQSAALMIAIIILTVSVVQQTKLWWTEPTPPSFI